MFRHPKAGSPVEARVAAPTFKVNVVRVGNIKQAISLNLSHLRDVVVNGTTAGGPDGLGAWKGGTAGVGRAAGAELSAATPERIPIGSAAADERAACAAPPQRKARRRQRGDSGPRRLPVALSLSKQHRRVAGPVRPRHCGRFWARAAAERATTEEQEGCVSIFFIYFFFSLQL
ncbi:MAG: hypothetical protein BJ554DRAFT_5494 [Olpidium bornovanus]|uniref:Uncharacterized protein n=1 Tax=Olpidium bornovanus TaxID=278681 RepID=A0A8H7ZZC3_9FUNG|nr:MAG: hypothetical protein BJ554DRAFT_5494 [Olpidium bornovanus]